MGETIIPLRRAGEARTPLTRIDTAATELLAAGRAPSLRAARVETILADLRVQRDRLVIALADLTAQGAQDRIDAAAAHCALILTVSRGIVEIDAFIARARAAMAAEDRVAPHA